MLRDWIADFAHWRSKRLLWLSEWWHDVAVWVTHRDSWRSIRSCRRFPARRQPLPRVRLGDME